MKEICIVFDENDPFCRQRNIRGVIHDHRTLSAQFEHSMGVNKDGVEVFTYSPQGLDKPPYK
jgi:hypothetical protein